jgi:hypothetical protein
MSFKAYRFCKLSGAFQRGSSRGENEISLNNRILYTRKFFTNKNCGTLLMKPIAVLYRVRILSGSESRSGTFTWIDYSSRWHSELGDLMAQFQDQARYVRILHYLTDLSPDPPE